MKTMKNILSILFLGFIAMTVSSCNDEIDYTPGEPSAVTDSKVFFSKDNVYDFILGVYDNEISIFLERTDASGSLKVDLLAENYDAAVFSVPSIVEFAAGETKKEVKIQVNNVEMFTNYSLKKLSIPSELVNPYKDYMTVSVNVYKEDYAPFAKGMYTSTFFGDQWEQVLEYSSILNLYRFSDLYVADYDFLFTWDGASNVVMQTTKTQTGYKHPSYGMVTAEFQASKYVEETQTLMFQYKWTVSAGSFGSYVESFVITEKY